MIPLRYSFQWCSHRFGGIDKTRIFGLAFPNTAAGFTAAIYWCFKRQCCWHRNFQLSTSVFFMFFFCFCFKKKSSYAGSMKKIPRHCLALSSLGFSIAHLCFAFRFDASDICFRISGHTLSGFEVVCFLIGLSPDQVYPSGGCSFNKMNLVKPVHASDNSLSLSTFQ